MTDVIQRVVEVLDRLSGEDRIADADGERYFKGFFEGIDGTVRDVRAALGFQPGDDLIFVVRQNEPSVLVSWGDGSATLFTDGEAPSSMDTDKNLLQRRLMAARLRYWADVVDPDTIEKALGL